MCEAGDRTPGPWQFTFFCKPDGSPIETAQDVAEVVAGSALKSDRAELFGVTLPRDNPDEPSVVVCYTGNGPNSHNNARFIAAAPVVIEAWQAEAAQQMRNAAYYRGLLTRCGVVFGVDGCTSEDGSIQDEPLVAKVPELVERQAAQLTAALKAEAIARHACSEAYAAVEENIRVARFHEVRANHYERLCFGMFCAACVAGAVAAWFAQ